ncbi:MAG: glycosyltransferase family 9 protein [Syntrophotaleaceae bacterium]
MKNRSFSDKWNKVRRLLVIRMDNIGDMVMLGPALQAIRENLPGAEISMLASPSGSQVMPLLPSVAETIEWRASWQDISKDPTVDPGREWSLVEKLRGRRFDAAIIFTSFTQSPYPPAYVTYLAGIPIRLGHSREFGGSLLSDWFKPPADTCHQVERNLFLLEQAGFRVSSREMKLKVSAADQAVVDALLSRSGVPFDEPYILLVPGASCASRRYDPHRFVSVIRSLSKKTRLPIVIAGSSKESSLLIPILQTPAKRHPGRVVSLLGQTSVPQFAAMVKRAALVVANNSSALHMADALRRPMVILYSGTELISQWRPRFTPAQLLRRETNCSPCYNFTCPFGTECLDIPASEVVDACLNLLAKTDLDRLPTGPTEITLPQSAGKGLRTR